MGASSRLLQWHDLPALLVLLVALAGAPPDGSAYNAIGTDPGSKWDDPTWGTPATVTWSYMNVGVGRGPGTPAHWTGSNTLGSGDPVTDVRAVIDQQYGAGAFDAAMGRALATWSKATGIRFIKLADQGGDMGTATNPDIRIGAFDFSEFAPGVPDLAGGAGFGPPGNDPAFPDALAGDLAFNHANRFTIAAGGEGEPLPTGPGGEYLNDVEGLVLHEIGHTLGLAHTDVPEAVMCGYVFPGDVFDGSSCLVTVVNRRLHPDDLAGIRAIYGPPPAAGVPIPPTALAALALLLAVGAGIGVSRR